MMVQQPAAAQDWDEDAPPPLDTISDQQHAAQLATSLIGTAGLQAGDLRVAAVTDSAGQLHPSCDPRTAKKQQPATVAAASKQPLKRGFLDAKPRSCGAVQQRSGARGGNARDGLPVLTVGKQQQQQQPGTKQIPDFMRVPLSPQEQQLSALKSKLISALQPTPETMAAVAGDATLLSGFDDPEVMAAVAEVARDPKAFSKHASNPKVQQFYKAMGGLVGAKLEKLGSSSANSGSSNSSRPVPAGGSGGGAAAAAAAGAARQILP